MLIRSGTIGLLFMTQLFGEIHHFKPELYWRELSSNIEPVLRIRPGDVVITTCVDSNGNDETGTNVTVPYNPLTGPFYIEGAETGDTLVVVLEQVSLNRPTGFGSTAIAATAVTPRYLMQKRFSSRSVTWQFDFNTMTATTDSLGGLKKLRLPLRPFLGTIGVAPPSRQAKYSPLMGRMGSAASSITADEHGGNVDYNQLVEGTTLYFPVFVPGAYLFMGDGHAAQGDGETSGGAIETSLKVRFRVSLLKNQQIPAMRAESDEYFMAIGTGRPLDEAFQRATVNMIEWLTSDFGLTPEEVHVLLGTSATYDIAVVATPRHTVVCKIKKTLIREIIVRDEKE